MTGPRDDHPQGTPGVLGLILAAGHSRRFGGDKRLADFSGQTLLAATTLALQPHVASVTVILRHGERPEALGLPADTDVVQAPSTPIGIGVSLAAAVSELLASTEPRHQQGEALALMLGDMPRVRADTLHKLVAQARHDLIVRPCHQGIPGHPVVFGRRFWPALADLDGDEGARKLLKRHQQQVVMLAVDDPGILNDVDTPADLPSPQ
ncbi:nucleotidyltransferase family protein [Kushneria indalinina]|uniref:Molybdenum cofactor cytidylyltransferase n=1 Tax=Kushneria indalinina DSM 14324 TaxID=1122140 RepID=A0A3D9DYL9_9GAMM|nr:nucleotidyltransferase family protein [Kushneria indalinina]REC95801.1 molybdenum cofactor cytidylyltransferase [Kushneria indalinina DSM 14324]